MNVIRKFEASRGMLDRVGIEMIIDDYEIIAVDCHGKEGEMSAFVEDVESSMDLYKRLMNIYSERIDGIKEKRRIALEIEYNRIQGIIDWASKKEEEEGE
jgi:predicted enzyme related to lactoylglutathione lyase